jgi:hypothetical protein
MLGALYDRALTGERCWIRHEDGRVHGLPVTQGLHVISGIAAIPLLVVKLWSPQ